MEIQLGSERAPEEGSEDDAARRFSEPLVLSSGGGQGVAQRQRAFWLKAPFKK